MDFICKLIRNTLPQLGFVSLGWIALLGASTFAQTMASNEHPIVGTWLTQSQSHISIEPCAQGYCGYISHVVIPQEIIDRYGEDQIAALQGNFVDANNENPSLRNRPIMGLQILSLRPGGGARLDGAVYNPQDGKTYEGFVEVLAADKVRLNGCIMFGTICQGEEWVRVPPVPTDLSDDGNAVNLETADASS